MLIAISDLHFSETESTRLGSLTFDRNLPGDHFRAYFQEVNQIAVANRLKIIDLVLAGDILEINRSSLWLESPFRPYISNAEVKDNTGEETLILRVLKAIEQQKRVASVLNIFKQLDQHFDVPVKLHYLPGNHDRLVNATPGIRRYVRRMLGLGDDDSAFDHQFVLPDADGKPFCIVRHGHEYDPMNFGMNLRQLKTIPTDPGESAYGAACLGDILTVEFGAALPFYFVQVYGEKAILADDILLMIYQRLMAFDDVRPTTALLSYLFSTPGVGKKQTWAIMKPCFLKIINALKAQPLLMSEIKEATYLKKSQKRLFSGLLNTDFLDNDLPYWMIKQVMKRVSKKIKLKSQEKWARKEFLIKNDSPCRCVISGHTHFPEVSLISASQGIERYYINTGTWRHVIPAAKHFKAFGRLRAATKVAVFLTDETSAVPGEMPWSFQYQTGLSFGNHRQI